MTPQPDGSGEATCSFESHAWALTLEDGDAIFSCTDPCIYDERAYLSGIKCCHMEWHHDDFCTPEPIPVKLAYVDDSMPSTSAGPAEHGYYIEVRRDPT